MAISDITTSIGPNTLGGATDYGSVGQNQIAQQNLAYATRDTATRIADLASTSLPKKEVSSLSTDGAKSTLNNAVVNHQADLSSIQNSIPTSPTTPSAPSSKISNESLTLLKNSGALTTDEMSATGMNKDNYNLDISTGLYIPKSSTGLPSENTSSSASKLDAQYEADKNTINSAFSSQISGMDTATQNLINSIQNIYSARIADQQATNQRELQTFDTMNTRYGTSRYAPGVAQGILTADERAGLDRINKIGLEEANLIATANQNLTDKKYSVFVQQRNELNNLRKERVTTLQKIQDAAAKKATDDRDYNLKLADFNEKSAQNKIVNDREAQKLEQGKYEFKDMKDEFGNTIGTQVFDKTTGRPISSFSQPGSNTTAPGSNGPLNPVGFDSNGGIDATAQKQFLGTLPPPIASLVQGLINYTAKPPANTKAGQKLNALAHQADPSYDESQYNIRQKLTLDYTSGQTGKNVQALNTAVNHLVDLSKNFPNLPNSDLTKYNTFADWYNSNVGKGDVTKVITDLNAVTGELAKVFKGTGATDEEIKNLKQGITLNSSPAQFKAFIEEATSLLGGRLDALNQTYENSVGKAFPRSFLTPDTSVKLSNLLNQGYSIDVPGVKYTDPKAFITSNTNNKALFQQAANQFPDYSAEEILQIIQD